MGGHAAIQVYDLLAASALSVGPATARPHVSLIHLWVAYKIGVHRLGISTQWLALTSKQGRGREKYHNSSTRRQVTLWHGKWEIKGNMLCDDWKELPNNPLPHKTRPGDTVTTIRATTGETLAKVLKTGPGNAEKLGP
jgi:hypothetical protein